LSGARGKILARWAACLILTGWHALPFILVVHFKIPPYAFGHESVGVRFMRAWRWLNDPTDYFYVPVGYLLDLLQRGIMLVLTVSGIDPRHNAETAFRWFALLTIGAHVLVMQALTVFVVLTRRLGLAEKIALTAAGASLGYLFYWAPLRLLVPDYGAEIIVLTYVGMVTLAIFGRASESGRPRPGLKAWSVAVYAGALVYLKLLLVVWVPLIVLAAAVSGSTIPQDRWSQVRRITLRSAVVFAALSVVGVSGHFMNLARLTRDTLTFAKVRARIRISLSSRNSMRPAPCTSVLS